MKVAATTIPRIYLGTMTWGWSQASSKVDEAVAKEMTDRFIQFNHNHGGATTYIDTALIYGDGKTERIVGSVLTDVMTMGTNSRHQNSIRIGTKAHPSQPGGLSREGIRQQLATSLAAMQVASCDEYYLHQPDPEHPLLESLICLNELIEEGTITKIGMSNYHVSEVRRVFELCNEHNLRHKPTVYQGLYNPLNRAVENDLIPLLHEHGCAFVAYNPLAAGLLSGKHTGDINAPVKAGRFKNNPNYLPRFYTKSNFEALAVIRQACDRENISMVDATYRWLLRHSALSVSSTSTDTSETGGGVVDGLLLGASSLSQLDQNLAACAVAADAEAGVLPDAVVDAFDEAWGITRRQQQQQTSDNASDEPPLFPYWRSYSSDMPNRDQLDPGASYSAAKK